MMSGTPATTDGNTAGPSFEYCHTSKARAREAIMRGVLQDASRDRGACPRCGRPLATRTERARSARSRRLFTTMTRSAVVCLPRCACHPALWLAIDEADAPVGILVLDGRWVDQLYVEPT